MKRSKLIKGLMAHGMPKKEASRMAEFLSTNGLARSEVSLLVVNPANTYGRCCPMREVYVFPETPSARTKVDKIFAEPIQI